MRVFAFPLAIEYAAMAFYDPLDEAPGVIVEAPDFLYVIDHPRGLVMFDSGVHPDKIRELGKAIAVTQGPGTPAQALASLGASKQDLRYLIQSHLHYDHSGGVASLEGVPVVVQRRELDFAMSPPVYQELFFHRPDFVGSVNWQLIEGSHDVFGDGTIVTLPTPGHTPGHQSLVVALDDGYLLLAADVHYSRQKMADRRLPGVLWNPDEMVASWELVEAEQRRLDARMIVSHELGFREDMPLAPAECFE